MVAEVAWSRDRLQLGARIHLMQMSGSDTAALWIHTHAYCIYTYTCICTWGSKTLERCIHNSKCESQPVLPHFRAVVEMKELFVLCCYFSENTLVGWGDRFLPTCQHFSLRMAVSKGNAEHMPMKWPKGLTITVMFSSVTPSTHKGFVQSFKVDKLLVRYEHRNIGRKSLFLCQ